jgi:hypothetical protein
MSNIYCCIKKQKNILYGKNNIDKNTMNVSKRSHRMTNNFHKCPTTRNNTPLYNLSDHTHYIFGQVKNNFQYTEHLMTILRVEELQILFAEELPFLC